MNILKNLNNERFRIMDDRDFHNYYINKYRMRLTDKQRVVIESKEEIVKQMFNRQEGCSTIALIKAIEYATEHNNCKILIAYPSANTVRTMNNYLNELLDRSHIYDRRDIIRTNPTAPIVRLQNGSSIKMIANSSIENARGECINCLIVDGDKYFDKYQKELLIASTLKHEDRQVVLLNQCDIYRGDELWHH